MQIKNNFGDVIVIISCECVASYPGPRLVSVQIKNNFGDVIVIISCECTD